VGLADAMKNRSNVVGFATKARRKVVIKEFERGVERCDGTDIDWSEVDYPADGGLQS